MPLLCSRRRNIIASRTLQKSLKYVRYVRNNHTRKEIFIMINIFLRLILYGVITIV